MAGDGSEFEQWSDRLISELVRALKGFLIGLIVAVVLALLLSVFITLLTILLSKLFGTPLPEGVAYFLEALKNFGEKAGEKAVSGGTGVDVFKIVSTALGKSVLIVSGSSGASVGIWIYGKPYFDKAVGEAVRKELGDDYWDLTGYLTPLYRALAAAGNAVEDPVVRARALLEVQAGYDQVFLPISKDINQDFERLRQLLTPEHLADGETETDPGFKDEIGALLARMSSTAEGRHHRLYEAIAGLMERIKVIDADEKRRKYDPSNVRANVERQINYLLLERLLLVAVGLTAGVYIAMLFGLLD